MFLSPYVIFKLQFLVFNPKTAPSYGLVQNVKGLTEFAAEIECLCARTPLVAVDAAVWLCVHSKLLVAACELVQSPVFVVLDVIPQLLEATVPSHVQHTPP